MSRGLLVTLRFHEGRWHGAGAWPPSPARLFQALVAAAARGAAIPAEAGAALEWLERQAPPAIAAPTARQGQAVKFWTPNNDLDAKAGDPARVGEIRVAKIARPWLFDAEVPLLYGWSCEDEPPAALAGVALRLCAVGRGVDPAWAVAEPLDATDLARRLAAHPGVLHRPGGAGEVAVPRPGTLASLVARHAGFRARFSTVGEGRGRRTLFRQPPRPLLRHVGYDAPPRVLHFDIRDGGRFAPRPLASAPALVRALRDAAAARLSRDAALAPLAERLLVGRGAGPADLPRRIRILPVPSVGLPEADPSIRRIAVEAPSGHPIRLDDLRWAFADLALGDPDTGEALAGRLVPGDGSLFARLVGPARRWRTLTPAALPGGPGRRVDPAAGARKGGAERAAEETAAARALARALRHAGLDPAVEIAVRREPWDRRGAMAGAFAASTRFDRSALWHAELRFARPVRGPLVIGDGRFLGLGLLRPADDAASEGLRVLPVLDGLAPEAEAEALARALRRAVMARVREATGSARLDPFFTGHAEDGAPLRDGGRAHLGFAADPVRGRLLILPPHLLDNRRATDAERRGLEVLDRALDGLDVLRAGPAGLLKLGPAHGAGDEDPLCAPAGRWRSLTDYLPTRHPRRLDDVGALAEDVAAECRRRRLPVPEVALAGPRRGLATCLALTFPRPVRGPIALGRSALRGGGLFAAADP